MGRHRASSTIEEDCHSSIRFPLTNRSNVLCGSSKAPSARWLVLVPAAIGSSPNFWKSLALFRVPTPNLFSGPYLILFTSHLHFKNSLLCVSCSNKRDGFPLFRLVVCISFPLSISVLSFTGPCFKLRARHLCVLFRQRWPDILNIQDAPQTLRPLRLTSYSDTSLLPCLIVAACRRPPSRQSGYSCPEILGGPH